MLKKEERRSRLMKKELFSILIFLLDYNLVLSQKKMGDVLDSMMREIGRRPKQLLAEIREKGFFKSNKVARVLLTVNRIKYGGEFRNKDVPFPITYGAFISAPSVHAMALEALKNHLIPGAKALDVGCGSGYMTAAMAVMMGNYGSVVGIDHLEGLVNIAYSNIYAANPKLLRDNRVKVIYADGRYGYWPEAPYDVIHCGAYAERIPDAFKKQLKPGGRIVMGVGNEENQQFVVADLYDDVWNEINLTSVSLMPLTDASKQVERMHGHN